jgi:hypothetical protein
MQRRLRDAEQQFELATAEAARAAQQRDKYKRDVALKEASHSKLAEQMLQVEVSLDICEIDVGEYIRGCPMPLTGLKCPVSKLVNSDACPRPTTQGQVEQMGQERKLWKMAKRADSEAHEKVRAFVAWPRGQAYFIEPLR